MALLLLVIIIGILFRFIQSLISNIGRQKIVKFNKLIWNLSLEEYL